MSHCDQLKEKQGWDLSQRNFDAKIRDARKVWWGKEVVMEGGRQMQLSPRSWRVIGDMACT
jgi:hypothetical protein